jgi:hypothetical protein
MRVVGQLGHVLLTTEEEKSVLKIGMNKAVLFSENNGFFGDRTVGIFRYRAKCKHESEKASFLVVRIFEIHFSILTHRLRHGGCLDIFG